MVLWGRGREHRFVAHYRSTPARWERAGWGIHEWEYLFLVTCEEEGARIIEREEEWCGDVVGVDLISCQEQVVGSLTNLALDGRFQKRIEGSQHILAGAMGFATGSVHDAQSVHLFGWHHKAWQRVARIHQTLKGLSRSGMLSQYSRGGERWHLFFRGVICLEEEVIVVEPTPR